MPKILVEIPVEVDGPLLSEERARFVEYLRMTAEPVIRDFVEEKFGGGARICDVCRFAFKEPEVTVE